VIGDRCIRGYFTPDTQQSSGRGFGTPSFNQQRATGPCTPGFT
jgi:hypothetical protein